MNEKYKNTYFFLLFLFIFFNKKTSNDFDYKSALIQISL